MNNEKRQSRGVNRKHDWGVGAADSSFAIAILLFLHRLRGSVISVLFSALQLSITLTPIGNYHLVMGNSPPLLMGLLFENITIQVNRALHCVLSAVKLLLKVS